MKNVCIGCIVFAAVTALVSSVQADDWIFSVGAHGWLPEWSYTKESYSLDKESGFVYGPSAFVSYKHFGFGVNYFTGSFDVEVGGEERSRDRVDMDFFANYAFKRYFSVFLGYKVLDIEKSERPEHDLTTQVDGFALGVAVTYPIKETHFFGYGSGFFMPKLSGDEKWEPRTEDGDSLKYNVDADGYNIELGLGYSFRLCEAANLSVKAGYRVQRFTYEFDSEYVRDAEEDFDGVRLYTSFVF